MNFTVPSHLPYPLASEECSVDAELRSTRAFALAQLGYTLLFENSALEALELFSEALRLDPKCRSIREWRATCYMSLGMYDKALTDLTHVVDTNPDYASGYNNRSVCYIRLGRLTEALEDLNKAINLNPEYVTAYINRARVHCLRGQYAQAQLSCNVGLLLNPTHEHLLSVQRQILAGLYSLNHDASKEPSP